MRRLVAQILSLIFCCSLSTALLASGEEKLPPELATEFRDVAGGLRCPTCTGLSVLDSDAPFSVQIKDIVAEQVQAGKSKEEIHSFFVQRYGPWILREPPKTGFHILAWIVPCLFLLGGPLVVWLTVWRRRKTFDTAGVRSATLILKEFDADIARRRKGGKT